MSDHEYADSRLDHPLYARRYIDQAQNFDDANIDEPEFPHDDDAQTDREEDSRKPYQRGR